jgi:hypothetical protein
MSRFGMFVSLVLMVWGLNTCTTAEINVAPAYSSTNTVAVPMTASVQVDRTPIPIETRKPAPMTTSLSASSTLPAFLLTPSPPPINVKTITPLPCYQATFINDVTYRDGTRVQPGEIFLKVWRFRNDGSCEWNFKFKLKFIDGERFSGPDDTAIQFFEEGTALDLELGDHDWSNGLVYRVRPGQIVDIPLVLRAPLNEGRQRGTWHVRSEDETSSVIQFYVDIEVTSTLEEEAGIWSGEWEHQSEWSEPSGDPLVFSQQGRQITGYYYNSDGECFLIDASLSPDGARMEGSFGQPWQAGYPFTLELFPDGHAFHGMYNDSSFNAGAWCGSRPGYDVPLGECMLRR